MKKYLFISNSTKPSKDKNESLEKVMLDNVSIPCIEAAINMKYKIFMGINRLNAEELECDYEIKFYNSSTYRSLTDIKSNFNAFKNLMKVLNQEDIDVIHCNTPIGGIMGRVCGKLAGVPKVIYTAHGFHFYEGAPLFNRTILKLAEKVMAKHTDVIITMNKEDYKAAKNFKLRNNGNVYLVPGVGINTLDYSKVKSENLRKELGLKEADIVFIAMGDLVKRKNYETSIKAIAECNNKNIHFIICGTGPEIENLKKLSSELNIDKQIHFLGFRRDVKKLLAISDVFLFTTLQEGLPRSMMEAMASGLPCIASKIRGNIDLIDEEKGGFLNLSQDIEGIANSINILSKNPELREKMGNYNLERVKHFDVENVKRVIMNIYENELK